LADSITLADLEQQQQAGIFTPVSPSVGLAHLPAAILTDAELVKAWSQGKRLACDRIDSARSLDPTVHEYVRVVDELDCCLGIAKMIKTDAGQLLLVPQTVLI
jgi:tRNA pseudouridine55 synthase